MCLKLRIIPVKQDRDYFVDINRFDVITIRGFMISLRCCSCSQANMSQEQNSESNRFECSIEKPT